MFQSCDIAPKLENINLSYTSQNHSSITILKQFVYTVFCQIHALARTPKNPEGRFYSGLIRSKSERCWAASGIPELAVSFLMRANQAVMRTQLTEIKWALVILDLRALVFVCIWIISWETTNRLLIQR